MTVISEALCVIGASPVWNSTSYAGAEGLYQTDVQKPIPSENSTGNTVPVDAAVNVTAPVFGKGLLHVAM